jgi:polar amino acid transport system substrate-binding protein
MPTGVLRVGLNAANTLVAWTGADGQMAGPAIDLAKGLAARLERPFELISHDSAASMIAALDDNAWDIACLAIDPARANLLHFTAPYLVIEASIVVAADSAVQNLADLDHPQTRIASAKGSAYDLRLRRTLQHAEIVSCETGADAFSLFAEGGADAVAGIRPLLDVFAATAPGRRVLADNFATIGQALAIPATRKDAASLLDSLIADIAGPPGH